MVTANGDSSHEIRRHLLLGRKAMTKLDNVLKNEKQRHYPANKGPYSQGFGFSSGHVWMWVGKKAECLGIDAFFLNDTVSFIKQTVTKRVS